MFGKKKVVKPAHPGLDNPEDSKSGDDSKRGLKAGNKFETDAKMSNITPDSKIKGTIKFGGYMRIDGKLDGEIMTDSGELVVGETATVKAAINTRSAVIEGRVKGNIIASDKVVLKQKAHLIGDLQAKTLVIEDGVVFVGHCNVNPEDSRVSRKQNT